MVNGTMKVYISGKISGMNYEDARQLFLNAEERLKAKGYETFNPFSYCEEKFSGKGGMSWEGYMMALLPYISHCDAIYMLGGWQKSYGANIEYLWAIRCGKEILFENPDEGPITLGEYTKYKELYEEYYENYCDIMNRNRKASKLLLVAIVFMSIYLISQLYTLIKHLL